jgi:L-seryl-tRNA(Ser) seleniumtransferase
LNKKASSWADDLAAAGLAVEVIDAQSVVGGGSMPGESLPTRALAIHIASPDDAAARLRACDPPVIVRREDGLLIVDPRTVLPRDEADLMHGLRTLTK